MEKSVIWGNRTCGTGTRNRSIVEKWVQGKIEIIIFAIFDDFFKVEHTVGAAEL